MTVRTLFAVSLFYTAMLFGCAAPTFTIETEPSGAKVLRGFFERGELEENPDFSWFNTNYAAYHYDSATVAKIGPLSDSVHFYIVVGTWCGDSKRELPKQFKILDALHVPESRIVMVGVDRTKQSHDGFTEKHQVYRVPTLIVFNGETELGRISEFPKETHEIDLLNLLKH